MENCAKKNVIVRTLQVGQKAQIQIEDTGTGIPPEVQKKIFEPFFRLTNVVDDRFMQETFRFGLGLTVVNKIIDLHKGSISFYTTDNSMRKDTNTKDVCVWVRFPIL
jgi:signal transduction histidine kinase